MLKYTKSSGFLQWVDMSCFEEYGNQIRQTMETLSALKEERIDQVSHERVHPVILFEFDGSRILRPSRGFRQILQFPRNLAEGAEIFEIVHPHDRSDVRSFAIEGQEVREDPASLSVELLVRFRRLDGTYRWLLRHSVGYKSSDPGQSKEGSVYTYACAAVDVTDSRTLRPLIQTISDQRQEEFERAYE